VQNYITNFCNIVLAWMDYLTNETTALRSSTVYQQIKADRTEKGSCNWLKYFRMQYNLCNH